ncbi:MAG: radical SAM protein [Candidatus Pacebacteria bacterium]|nr:radical SAM protein [Candidatus Paceibacterota bacterium]
MSDQVEKIKHNWIDEVRYSRRVLTPLISFIITNRCNFNCPHCSRSLSNFDKDLSVSTFEMVLREGKKMNFSTVSLTGGEAILHPRFKEFLKLLKKYDYRFNFVSNGWLYEDYWNDVKDYKDNLAAIFLSLDGATAEIHDAVRNRIGSFDRVIEAIKFYRDKKIPVGINFCITGDNYHQIEKVADLCLELGVWSIKYLTIIPSSKSDLSVNERLGAAIMVSRIQNKLGEKVFISRSTQCFNGAESSKVVDFCNILNCQQPSIDYDGGVIFCCDIFRGCKNKPLIKNVGFKRSIEINLDVILEIKKKRLSDLFKNSKEALNTCDYCNKYAEKYFDLVSEK